MDQERLFRSILQEKEQNSFVDKILNNNNIQMHGSLNAYCRTSYDPSNNDQQQGQSEPMSNALAIQDMDPQLDDFKNKVKIWIKLDNEIKELNNKIKVLDNERKQRKKYMMSLTPHILSYMNMNEIEELNSRDGKIQYKCSMIKPPLSQKDVKSKLYNTFTENHDELDHIFSAREKIQKVSLRRYLN